MKSPEDVAAIPDLLERLTVVSDLLHKIEARAEAARSERDLAIIAARDQGEPPVTIYRDTLAISRGLYNRIMQRAPASAPDVEDPLRKAKAANKRARTAELLIVEYRKIRDDTASMLMNGYDEQGNRIPTVSNADIARITGLTTARIAQMRKVI